VGRTVPAVVSKVSNSVVISAKADVTRSRRFVCRSIILSVCLSVCSLAQNVMHGFT